MIYTHQVDINRYIEYNKSLDHNSLESALVFSILNFNNKLETKNKLLINILNHTSPEREKAAIWIKESIENPSLDHLLTFYELCISEKDRVYDGAYFTPMHIVNSILELTIKNSIGSVCDPSCGSGAFLLSSINKLYSNNGGSYEHIIANYIWGIDINEQNVIHTKTVLTIFMIINGIEKEEFNFNIFKGNSLIFSWSETPKGDSNFDFIVGNPPYVRGKNLNKVIKQQIKEWDTANHGIPDLYIPFFEIAFKWASKKGKIGFITPNTYFSSVNGKKLRKFIAENRILETIIDFGGYTVFEGLLTYTCITILNKETTKYPKVGIIKNQDEIKNITKTKVFKISHSDLKLNDWYILDPKLSDKLRKFESRGTSLDKYVNKFSTGIATLKNNIYILNSEPKENFIEVCIGSRTFKIEIESTVPIIKPNKVKTINQLKNNKERIIFPYFRDRKNKVRLIPEQELSKKFPGTYSYLSYYKKELENRSIDKGSPWYAFGRSQSIDGFGEKIIFPMMSDKPAFLYVEDPNTLIYCGYALYPKNNEQINILLKVLNSNFFWYYIRNTSKNYANGYKSLAKNYVKKFSIPEFNKQEIECLLKLKEEELDEFLMNKYCKDK